MSNNAINMVIKHARAFGAHVFATGYGERCGYSDFSFGGELYV